MKAFFDEIEKIAIEERSLLSPWKSKTVGAPRAKLTPIQAANAPTLSENLSPKLVGPASQYGKRQNYTQPNIDTSEETNPEQHQAERTIPPPTVSYGVR